MKISIITITYNSAATVRDAIASIDAQDYGDIEHIVVDGLSQDATLELVAKHPKPWRRVVSESDKGIYDAMNKGFGLATGDVIGFLNSDDMYASSFVVSEIARVFQDSNVDACYADLVYVDQQTAKKVIRYWQSFPYRAGLFAKGVVPPHPTFYVRRAVYQEFGGFDDQYLLAADYLYMLKLLEVEGINSCHVPQVWVKMRIGGATNKSIGNVIKQNLEIYFGARSLGIRLPPLYFVLSKIWIRLSQFVRRNNF